jgi:hypothetical protein
MSNKVFHVGSNTWVCHFNADSKFYHLKINIIDRFNGKNHWKRAARKDNGEWWDDFSRFNDDLVNKLELAYQELTTEILEKELLDE